MKGGWLAPLVRVALLGLISPMAVAQDFVACQDVFQAHRSDQQQLQSALALEPQCHRQTPYLYRLGRLLNQAGRYAEAVDRLEAALLYDPSHLPSQLEYAVALAGVGDTASATALLTELAGNPDLTATQQQQVTAMQQLPAQPASSRLVAGLAAGYDDNLLGSNGHSQLELTVPGARLLVQTDPSQLPHAGAFVRADLRYDGELATSTSQRWRYSLVASQRQSPGYSLANLGQWGVLLENSDRGQQGLYSLIVHQQQRRSDNLALQQTQLSVGADFGGQVAGLACSQRLGLDLQQLRNPGSPAINGNYRGIMGQTHCPDWGVQLQWRLGKDLPQNADRPGGEQSLQSARLIKTTPMQMGQLALELELAHQTDHDGYSPLLENNTPRKVRRQAFRLEYRWQAGRVSPYVSFEWLAQQANLPLFELQNQVLALGVRSSW